jgi:hypothetical protein
MGGRQRPCAVIQEEENVTIEFDGRVIRQRQVTHERQFDVRSEGSTSLMMYGHDDHLALALKESP